MRLKRFDEALASLDEALALAPGIAETHLNRGNVLNDLKRHEDAVASYDSALAIRPDYPEALSNRGIALHALARDEDALASFDRALALRPDYPEALSHRGATLDAMQRPDEALTSYARAIALRPDYADAYGNRGATLYNLKRLDEALADFDHALALRPDLPEVHWNQASARLIAGDFERGFAEYEWRWQREAMIGVKRDFPQPLWRGEDIAGKTILLHSEQGFGDSVQFCRYVPAVAARGARVILEVEAPLQRLMTTLAGVSEVIAKGENLPAFDTYCPLLSLPLAFGTRLGTVPSVTPYLRAQEQDVAAWTTRLSDKRRPRVGLAWSGNPTHLRDADRSIALEALLPLTGVDASFVSVQKDVRDADAGVLAARTDILQVGHALNDFADTAALLSELDLIITVDTSVAHLAGALGKPVWLLLPYIPDWRWLFDRETSPWYPTARLFRQDESRSYDGVIARVRDALQRGIESGRF